MDSNISTSFDRFRTNFSSEQFSFEETKGQGFRNLTPGQGRFSDFEVALPCLFIDQIPYLWVETSSLGQEFVITYQEFVISCQKFAIDDSAKDGGPHFTQCMIGKCPLVTHSYQNLQLQA